MIVPTSRAVLVVRPRHPGCGNSASLWHTHGRRPPHLESTSSIHVYEWRLTIHDLATKLRWTITPSMRGGVWLPNRPTYPVTPSLLDTSLGFNWSSQNLISSKLISHIKRFLCSSYPMESHFLILVLKMACSHLTAHKSTGRRIHIVHSSTPMLEPMPVSLSHPLLRENLNA